jgi:Spy/CpxP family protein refolding chaperone
MKKLKPVLLLTQVLFFASLFVPAIYGQGSQRARRPAVLDLNRMPIKVLDLSEKQKEMLKNLREAQRELQDQFREKSRNLREELEGLREDPGKNRARIENLQDELFNLRLEVMKNHYAYGKEIKKVFTTEQLEKLSMLRHLQMRRGPAMNSRAGRQGRMRGNARGPQRGTSMRFPRRWRR